LRKLRNFSLSNGGGGKYIHLTVALELSFALIPGLYINTLLVMLGFLYMLKIAEMCLMNVLIYCPDISLQIFNIHWSKMNVVY